jgi:GTP-binding protein
MKITSAEFIISVAHLHQVPAPVLPEVAFIGRSNVGKSSLINSLCNRKSLAKTSTQPGKTRVLNFYRINNSIHFVDLPGYGYAKVPDQIRYGWQQIIEGYLKTRKNLRLGLVLLDSRHEPTRLDRAMIEWLEYYEIPFAVILTKADKLSRHRVQLRTTAVKNITKELHQCLDILTYSSVTGEGKPALVSLIRNSVTPSGFSK